MAEILLSVLTEHLALVAADWPLHNNLRFGRGQGIHIRWGHALTLLVNCVLRNMNQQEILVFTTAHSTIARKAACQRHLTI